MRKFFAERGRTSFFILAAVGAIAVIQTVISYTLFEGSLKDLKFSHPEWIRNFMVSSHFLGFLFVVACWLFNQRALFKKSLLLTNVLFSVALITQTLGLVVALFGLSSKAVDTLLLDVVLMIATNIVIFSIWYTWLDSPIYGSENHGQKTWKLLFPQRAANIPGYLEWVPGFWDYFYLAFTVNFSFSPSETAPLSGMAKLMMGVQAAVSVTLLTLVAGGAINQLAGNN